MNADQIIYKVVAYAMAAHDYELAPFGDRTGIKEQFKECEAEMRQAIREVVEERDRLRAELAYLKSGSSA